MTDKQTDRRTDGQTDRQTDRQTIWSIVYQNKGHSASGKYIRQIRIASFVKFSITRLQMMGSRLRKHIRIRH